MEWLHTSDSQTHGRVSIFASGKLISVGTKSEKQAQEDIKRTMTKLGITPNEGIKILVVRNIVATTDLGYDINLEEIRGGIYEPEQFPGVILQSKTNTRVKILLFASGKAVMVGLQNTSEIPKIIEEIKSFIK